MTAGERIREARIQRGMTQKQLGERAGIAEPTIRKYELGKLNPKYETMRKIASALDVTVGYIQGYETMNTKQLLDAVRQKDVETLERMFGMPPNSIQFLSEAEENELIEKCEAQSREKEKNLNLLKSFVKFNKKSFTQEDLTAIKDLLFQFFMLNKTGQKKAVEQIYTLAKETASNTPDNTVSEIETDNLDTFDRVCQLTGHYVRPKLDDLSGYYLGKHGEEAADVFLSNKEFRALVKRIAAATAAMIDSEIEVAKDDAPPK